MPAPRHIGVLLAAGRGGRMGGRKQLTPWPTPTGERPLVAAAYDAIRPICDDMVVVLGYDAESVAAALGERAFHRAKSSPDAPMFDSIREGLRVAQQLDRQSVVVLQPGDHPVVNRFTLGLLWAMSSTRPEQAIIPQFGGRGGHPVFIPPAVVSRILAADCPAGLGQFWHDQPEWCERVTVEDAGVVRDIDTPADLD